MRWGWETLPSTIIVFVVAVVVILLFRISAKSMGLCRTLDTLQCSGLVLLVQVFYLCRRAGTHPETRRENEKERLRVREKWEILSCTGSVECLTIIICDGIITAQSNSTPDSIYPSHRLSLSLWSERNWQSDFTEPRLNFVTRVFIIPRVSFFSGLIYECFPHFNLCLCMKSVPMELPYTGRLMNPICKSDLLAAKAHPLLSLLMPAF